MRKFNMGDIVGLNLEGVDSYEYTVGSINIDGSYYLYSNQGFPDRTAQARDLVRIVKIGNDGNAVTSGYAVSESRKFAFTPVPEYLSRRDSIALGILNGFISKWGSADPSAYAESVYWADKLIAELDKPRDGK